MGTAQLLYITLGIIVIGIAIIAGMNMTAVYHQENNREQLISHATTILTMAEEYYKKPVDLGGGGGSYKKFKLSAGMEKNDYGRFRITGNNNRININATGLVEGRDGIKPVRVIARITRNKKNPGGEMLFLIRN